MTRSLTLLSLLAIACLAFAAKPELPDPWENWDEAYYMDMDFVPNLNTPELAESDQKPIRNYMARMYAHLAKEKYMVQLDRDGEVLVVTIPTSQLFRPNETQLAPTAAKTLKPLTDSLDDDAEMFKVVYAVHTDDTGSDAYQEWLSLERSNEIYNWLLDHVSEDLILIPFSFGDTDPIATNATRDGRAQNRRVEFYLIPGPSLIDKARKKKLR